MKMRTQRIKSQQFEDTNGIVVTNFSAAGALGTSDVIIPTQKAVKTYADAAIAGGTKPEGEVTFPMSFETGEETATKIYFPMKVTINKIRTIVTKALAAVDVGTITGANSTGDSNNGVVTVAISAALNEEDSAVPDTNNVVLADGYYKLTTAKTTDGGKVLVTLEYTLTA